MMYEMLPVSYIQAWLRSLIMSDKPGPREGISIYAVARYTGIPHGTLEMLMTGFAPSIGEQRQRLLSKVIAQVENGHLVFVGKGCAKRAIMVDNPKPRVRYEVQLVDGEAKLKTVARPRAVAYMPSFKDVMLK